MGLKARLLRRRAENPAGGGFATAAHNDPMKLKVFITGGTGFIGRNLVERLQPIHHVLAPTHQELDLLDEAAVRHFFERHTVDVVIHAAVAPGHRNAKDPTNLVFKNTRMFFNLIRNAGRFEKLIHLSSGAVYDQRQGVARTTEDSFDKHVPSDESGFSKYVCSKYIERAGNIVELRPFGVFGKYEDYEIRFISNVICKTLYDLPITIKQNRRFDYLYADDLVQVVGWFITHDAKHKFYNVTSGAAMELQELARMVLEISGKQLEIVIATPGMGPEYSGDNSRLRTELPALDFTPISQAMGRLYTWYTQNVQSIRKEALLADK